VKSATWTLLFLYEWEPYFDLLMNPSQIDLLSKQQEPTTYILDLSHYPIWSQQQPHLFYQQEPLERTTTLFTLSTYMFHLSDRNNHLALFTSITHYLRMNKLRRISRNKNPRVSNHHYIIIHAIWTWSPHLIPGGSLLEGQEGPIATFFTCSLHLQTQWDTWRTILFTHSGKMCNSQLVDVTNHT